MKLKKGGQEFDKVIQEKNYWTKNWLEALFGIVLRMDSEGMIEVIRIYLEAVNKTQIAKLEWPG